MQPSATHEAIREFQEGSREQGLEIPIDPACLSSSSQGLMLCCPKPSQSLVLSADRSKTAGYGASGPPGRRLAVIGCAKPTRSSDRFDRSSAGPACLAIAARPFPTPTHISSRFDSSCCCKHGPRSPLPLELRT
jgi:hypothetical protein